MAQPLLPGQRLGAFVLVRELARGGMGAVWIAESQALGRQVAIKVLLEGASEQIEDRFEIEAVTGARLQHPNVVAVHEVGVEEGRAYLVMDLVDGETLEARVRRDGPLAEEEALGLLIPVARAVEYAHGEGVLHRDLKPSNVLVNQDGRPQITDFGLAKDLRAEGGLTETGSVMGTPAYMSPEQANGEVADTRSDVYALGAILYTLLCGSAPFKGQPIQIVHAVLTKPPKPPSLLRKGLTPDLEAICLVCLEKDPAHRYPTAAAFADDLERARCGEPVQARTLGAGARAARWVVRKRRLVGALTVLALALAAFGVVALWRATEPPAPIDKRPGMLAALAESEPKRFLEKVGSGDIEARVFVVPAFERAIRGEPLSRVRIALGHALKSGVKSVQLAAAISTELDHRATSWGERFAGSEDSKSDLLILDELKTWIGVVPGVRVPIGGDLRGSLDDALKALIAKSSMRAIVFEHSLFYEIDPVPRGSASFYAAVRAEYGGDYREVLLTRIRYGGGAKPLDKMGEPSKAWERLWPSLAAYQHESRLAGAQKWWAGLGPKRPCKKPEEQFGNIVKVLEREGLDDLHPITCFRLLSYSGIDPKVLSPEAAKIYQDKMWAEFLKMLKCEKTNLDTDLSNCALLAQGAAMRAAGPSSALRLLQETVELLSERLAYSKQNLQGRVPNDRKALARALRLGTTLGGGDEKNVKLLEESLEHWKLLPAETQDHNDVIKQLASLYRKLGRSAEAIEIEKSTRRID